MVDPSANLRAKPPCAFPGRTFQLWAYTVSHQSVLPRSTRGDLGGGSTRIDILFKGVERLDVPTRLSDLVVSVGTPSPHPAAGPSALRWGQQALNHRGYIDALVVATHEDDAEFFEPSPLWDHKW